MRILIVGAGGVGSSAALIAARRDFFEHFVVADYDLARAAALVERLGDPRFVAAQVDASDAQAVADLCPRARGHPRPQRRRPALRAADLRRRAASPAPTTSTWR